MPEALVQEAKEPQWDVLLVADLEVADGAITDACLAWRGGKCIHVVLTIDDEHRTAVGGIDLVVAVQGSIEERLGYRLLIWLACASSVA